jgi:hypothetical protein
LGNLKVKKEGVVAEIKERLSKAKVVILTDYRGLNVSAITELRRQLREEDIEYKVVKNTLTKIAVGELGYEGLDHIWKGPPPWPSVTKTRLPLPRYSPNLPKQMTNWRSKRDCWKGP